MGYSTCEGRPRGYHRERRTCDYCDACGTCQERRMVHMWCWRCCGQITACEGECAERLANHIVEHGPPQGTWATRPEIVRGYNRARNILKRFDLPVQSVLVLTN